MNWRLKSVCVRNFMSLADVDLDIGPVNLLTGTNGAGKSNLLRAIMAAVLGGREIPPWVHAMVQT